MTNAAELECALIRANISKRKFAELLGISIQALYNKLNNDAEFKVSEIMNACKILRLTAEQRETIFFDTDVAKVATKGLTV